VAVFRQPDANTVDVEPGQGDDPVFAPNPRRVDINVLQDAAPIQAAVPTSSTR
jgi:hypothetical protein